MFYLANSMWSPYKKGDIAVIEKVQKRATKLIILKDLAGEVANVTKKKACYRYRKRTPANHAAFLEHLSNLVIEVGSYGDVQENFDIFYHTLYTLLDQFYPERVITVTSTNPHFITPAIKAMLRRKNRLMRAGRTDEANALAKRVRASISRQNSLLLRDCDTRKSVKLTWAKVRQVLHGRNRNSNSDVAGVDASILNNHYAAISKDHCYTEPRSKLSVLDSHSLISEMDVFYMLDRLKPTVMGLDAVPAWFLQLGAPAFAAPLATLLNQSFSTSVVPRQWKYAAITPVPKITKPTQCSDLRPISVTSVLSRLTERYIVRTFIYPALLYPPPALNFSDQFAFRPSGSTTAALVALLHTVGDMLSTNSFVYVIGGD